MEKKTNLAVWEASLEETMALPTLASDGVGSPKSILTVPDEAFTLPRGSATEEGVTMSRMHRWTITLGMVCGLTGPATAGETAWSVPATPSAPPATRASLGPPVSAATLGRPEPATTGTVFPVGYDSRDPRPVARGQAPDSIPPVGLPGPGVLPGVPPVGLTTSTSLDGPPPPPPPVGGAPVVPPTYGPLPGTTEYNTGVNVSQPLNHSWTDTVGGWFGGLGGPNHFHSNVFCQGDIISPVSNPFFFEDPRALTEIKPLFIYQEAPKGTPIFHGGDAEFYGVQGRVAITDHWSIVLNKFGLVSLHVKDLEEDPTGEFRSTSTGFAEVYLGPKYTFFHSEDYGTLAAGLTFELAIGSDHVFQNTGTLGLDPYLSYGVGFGRTSYGKFNFVGEIGYSFATDNDRSQFFHSSLHLDYNVANLDKIFPLVELNYFYYTKEGKADDLPFEGGDLVNFGASDAPQRDYLQMALGMRYKFNENIQVGGAFEFPLDHKDIELYRFNLDVIFRF